MKSRLWISQLMVSSCFMVLIAVSHASSFGPPPKELLARKGLDTSLESLESYALDASLEPEVRMLALHAIRDENNKQSVDVVIQLLYDKNPEIRLFAASTLGFLKAEKSVPHLVDFLKVEQMPSAYGFALNGLALLGTQDAIAALFDVAKNSQAASAQRSSAIRMVAALSRSGKVDPSRIGEELASGLSDSDPEIRAMTAHAMTSAGVSKPIQQLVDAAKDERISFEARAMVLNDIEQVSGEKFGFSPVSSAKSSNADAILRMETWWANERSMLEKRSEAGGGSEKD